MVLTEFRSFGFQFISLYFGFYVLGYTLNKYKVKFQSSYIMALGILWLILSLFWRMHDIPTPVQWACKYIPSSLITYGYRYFTALIGSLFFIGLAMQNMNRDNKICRMLAYFGKISLGIYIVHLFLAKFFEQYYIGFFISDTSFVFVLFDFFLKLSVSCLIVSVLQRIPIVSLLFLGKSK